MHAVQSKDFKKDILEAFEAQNLVDKCVVFFNINCCVFKVLL
jgi:hypothetical protein